MTADNHDNLPSAIRQSSAPQSIFTNTPGLADQAMSTAGAILNGNMSPFIHPSTQWFGAGGGADVTEVQPGSCDFFKHLSSDYTPSTQLHAPEVRVHLPDRRKEATSQWPESSQEKMPLFVLPCLDLTTARPKNDWLPDSSVTPFEGVSRMRFVFPDLPGRRGRMFSLYPGDYLPFVNRPNNGLDGDSTSSVSVTSPEYAHVHFVFPEPLCRVQIPTHESNSPSGCSDISPKLLTQTGFTTNRSVLLPGEVSRKFITIRDSLTHSDTFTSNLEELTDRGNYEGCTRASLKRKSNQGAGKNSVDLQKKRRLAANARERKRMYSLNAAFEKLRSVVPSLGDNQQLSKYETLQMAQSYITALQELLDKEK